jgi:hypothetical protein
VAAFTDTAFVHSSSQQQETRKQSVKDKSTQQTAKEQASLATPP